MRAICASHYTLEWDGFAELLEEGNSLHEREQVFA